jgi:hypothetical protein
MLFTPHQINEILSVLNKYVLTFVAHRVGTNVLSINDETVLRQAGIDLSSITANQSNITQAFKFGLLSQALQDNAVRSMTYLQFKEYLAKGRMFKLTALENSALANLQAQTYRDVLGLGSRIQTSIGNMLVNANRQANTVTHHKIVTDAAKQAIIDRRGVTSVISEIGHATAAWHKDLGRIADFVMHTAFDEGRSIQIAKVNGDNALVYKDVYAGACPHCQKAFLTGGVGSIPKLFKLSDLRMNGTNVGRKVAEWKPVIGPLHPWCRCTLMNVPNGFTLTDLQNGLWEWNGTDFVRVEGTYVRRVQRRSKVKVTVNGETTEI